QRHIRRLRPRFPSLGRHGLLDPFAGLAIGHRDLTAHGLLFRSAIRPDNVPFPPANVLPRALAVLAIGIPPVFAITLLLLLLRRFAWHFSFPAHCQRSIPNGKHPV